MDVLPVLLLLLASAVCSGTCKISASIFSDCVCMVCSGSVRIKPLQDGNLSVILVVNIFWSDL